MCHSRKKEPPNTRFGGFWIQGGILSVVHSFEVFLGLGVYPDFFTLLDEDGNADLQAGLGGDVFGCTLHGVTLDGFLGLGDQKNNLRRNLDFQQLGFPEGAAIGLSVLHQVLVVGEVAHRNLNLLEVVGQHQVEILPVVVQILAVPIDYGDILGVVLALHRLLERLTGGRTLQLQANEGGAFSWIYEFTVDNNKRLSFDQQGGSLIDLTCFNHAHYLVYLQIARIATLQHTRKGKKNHPLQVCFSHQQHLQAVKPQRNSRTSGHCREYGG